MKIDKKIDVLRLENQLCFPLYTASRLVIRLYGPLLEELGLTYLQYIVLLVLWQEAPCSVSHIGLQVLLETSTLTPLLKRLERQGLIVRQRSSDDERSVLIHLTKKGRELRERCVCIPFQLADSLDYSQEEALDLKARIETLIARLTEHKPVEH